MTEADHEALLDADVDKLLSFLPHLSHVDLDRVPEVVKAWRKRNRAQPRVAGIAGELLMAAVAERRRREQG